MAITPFEDALEKLNLRSFLARRMVEVKHDETKEKTTKMLLVIITTILQLMVLISILRNLFWTRTSSIFIHLNGMYEDSTSFGYFFTSPYVEESICILLPYKKLPALTDGNPYFDSLHPTWCLRTRGCPFVGVSLYYQSKARSARKKRSREAKIASAPSNHPPFQSPYFISFTHRVRRMVQSKFYKRKREECSS